MKKLKSHLYKKSKVVHNLRKQNQDLKLIRVRKKSPNVTKSISAIKYKRNKKDNFNNTSIIEANFLNNLKKKILATSLILIIIKQNTLLITILNLQKTCQKTSYN